MINFIIILERESKKCSIQCKDNNFSFEATIDKEEDKSTSNEDRDISTTEVTKSDKIRTFSNNQKIFEDLEIKLEEYIKHMKTKT